MIMMTRRTLLMSKRERDKPSKSSYARQARKQHKAEDMFLLEIEKEQLQNYKPQKKKYNHDYSNFDED